MEREIVRGHHRPRTRLTGIVQICGRKAGLPVVRVDNMRLEVTRHATAYRGSALGERGETHSVVRPILAVGPRIRPARTSVEMRCVENKEVHTGCLHRKQSRRGAMEVGELVHRLRRGECIHHRRVTGDQGAHRDAFLRENGRQRADHVAQAAGLDHRIGLRRDREDANASHTTSQSPRPLAGWLIRLDDRSCVA